MKLQEMLKVSDIRLKLPDISSMKFPGLPSGKIWTICLSVGAGIVCTTGVAYIYVRAIRGRCTSKADLTGKTVLITGANTGIGYYTALDIAKRNARVIVAGRNKDKIDNAVDKIREDSGNPGVVSMILDVSSIKSVRSFADEFKNTERRLDILINNAGMADWEMELTRTEEGLEIIMATNHLGHFLLTNLLMGMLEKSGSGRIINVSSIAHRRPYSKLDLDNLNSQNHFDKRMAYGNSKLCNLYHARELARRGKETGVTAYAVHPGFVATEIWRHTKPPRRWIIQFFSKLFFKTSEEGAQTTIYCAVQEGIEEHSGKYFADCRVAAPDPLSQDDVATKKLWRLSEELVNSVPRD